MACSASIFSSMCFPELASMNVRRNLAAIGIEKLGTLFELCRCELYSPSIPSCLVWFGDLKA